MPKIKMPMTLCKDDELSFSAAFELFLVDGAALFTPFRIGI